MKTRVPADVDMPDRIFLDLTARQLVVLGIDLLVVWALYMGVGARVPLGVFVVVALPVMALGMVCAFGTVGGLVPERLAVDAARCVVAPRRRVLAPEGLRPPPAWMGTRERVGAFELPARGVGPEGCVEVGDGGVAVVCRASQLNLGLRSEGEQEALVEGLGRFLNALDAPVQILVRCERADLRAEVAALERDAAGLPHPALERAALEHAAFLRGLEARGEVLRREVLVCFFEAAGSGEAAVRLAHRVEEAAGLLRSVGVRLRRLSAGEATELLGRCSDPEAPARPHGSLPAGVVEGRR